MKHLLFYTLLLFSFALCAEDKNIASRAELRTVPLLKGLDAASKITDGNVDTGARFRTGIRMGGTYEFVFKKPFKLKKIRFIQGINQRFTDGSLHASEYIIEADTTGDGSFDTEIVHSTEGEPGKWIEHITDEVKVFGIRFKAIKGIPQWECSYPFLREFEIYTDEDFEFDEKQKQTAKAFPENINVLQTGEKLKTKPFTEKEKNEYIKGIVVNFWNFGLYPYMKEKNFNFEGQNIIDDKRFKEFIEKLQSLDANTVCLMRECRDQLINVCWPSEKFKTVSPKRDLLQEFSDAMHKYGFKVHVNFTASVTSGYLEQQQKDPYRLTHTLNKKAWTELIKETSSKNIDGIYICPDEIFFKPFSLSRLPEDHPARQAFTKRFGAPPVNASPAPAQKLLRRKQAVFNYEQIGALLKYWNDAAKSVNPSIKTLANIGSHPIAYNNRYIYGLAYDIIAPNSGTDFFGIDYQNKYTRRITAAFPQGKNNSIIFSPKAPGDALECIFQGAKGITFYRYNYILKENGAAPVRAAFLFCDTLASWGFANTKEPETIALIVSRASEDWYGIAHGLFTGIEKNWKGKYGFWSYKIMTEILHKYNYPYKVFYLDQPDSLEKLKNYSLAILPFAYSLSKNSLEKLEGAFDSGTKFLIFDKKGEVDEFGKNYDSALLHKIITEGEKDGKTFYFKENLCDMKGNFAELIKKRIDILINNSSPFYLENFGKNVSAYMLEKNATDKVLAFINREKENVPVESGILNLPEGTYSISIKRSTIPEDEYTGTINGKTKFTEKDISCFGFKLEPEETVMLHIQKIE